MALSLPVGSLIKNATSYKQNFLSLSPGNGVLPASVPVEPLSLEVALNKLKHRDSIAVNFSITNSNSHSLYIFTNAGMGQPDSISEFNMDVFCNVGKQAANAI